VNGKQDGNSGAMTGANDGFSEIPPVANQNLQTQAY
jgi:hypothetical protein